MCQVSGGEMKGPTARVHGLSQAIDAVAAFPWRLARLHQEPSSGWFQQSIVSACVKQAQAQSKFRQSVSVALGNSFDQAVQTHFAQQVGHPTRRHVGHVHVQQCCKLFPQITVAKAIYLQLEDQQGL